MSSRNVVLPQPHNQRADEMWAIIEPHVDWENKTVLDLGCGHGDMALRAWRAGAAYVECVEHNSSAVWNVRQKIDELMAHHDIRVYSWDIDDLPGTAETGGGFNVIFCFSVLPYLLNPDRLLMWMRDNCETAFIECQYAGDGPGFGHIHNDGDMRRCLHRIGWRNVSPIGRTHTRIRDAWRTIWKCKP